MPLMVAVGDMVRAKDGIEDYKQRFAGEEYLPRYKNNDKINGKKPSSRGPGLFMGALKLGLQRFLVAG